MRRAAEIQNKRGNAASQLLTEEEVVEIGRQVGLEPERFSIQKVAFYGYDVDRCSE